MTSVTASAMTPNPYSFTPYPELSEKVRRDLEAALPAIQEAKKLLQADQKCLQEQQATFKMAQDSNTVKQDLIDRIRTAIKDLFEKLNSKPFQEARQILKGYMIAYHTNDAQFSPGAMAILEALPPDARKAHSLIKEMRDKLPAASKEADEKSKELNDEEAAHDKAIAEGKKLRDTLLSNLESAERAMRPGVISRLGDWWAGTGGAEASASPASAK